MREVKRRDRVIGNSHIDTWQTQPWFCNTLEVEVGTTGFCGGDSGHGGRTYIRLQDIGGSDIEIKMIEARNTNVGFELLVGGDSELQTLIEALEFAVEVLKSESRR